MTFSSSSKLETIFTYPSGAVHKDMTIKLNFCAQISVTPTPPL